MPKSKSWNGERIHVGVEVDYLGLCAQIEA